jgi:hypothetical protein
MNHIKERAMSLKRDIDFQRSAYVQFMRMQIGNEEEHQKSQENQIKKQKEITY